MTSFELIPDRQASSSVEGSPPPNMTIQSGKKKEGIRGEGIQRSSTRWTVKDKTSKQILINILR